MGSSSMSISISSVHAWATTSTRALSHEEIARRYPAAMKIHSAV